MKITKILSLVLCFILTLGVLSGCGGNGATSSDVSGTSSTSSANQGLGGFGQKLVMTSPSGSFFYGNEFNVTWKGTKAGETVSILLEKKNGNSFTKVLEKTGLTGTEFKSGQKLENATYRIKLTAVSKDGTERLASNTKGDGLEITIVPLVKNATINKGRNFTFNGSISLDVLNNYLDRAATYYLYEMNSQSGLDTDKMNESLRALLNMGVKYVNRATTAWTSSSGEELYYTDMAKWIEFAHSYDPEIIFEACIFETCSNGMASIKIPDWVFKAFGKKVEDRNFDNTKMLFSNKYGFNQWGDGIHIPDITKEETQMWFYYKACRYIDMGYESLHLGQANLIGKQDTGNKCWTKVINMIREYAKTHARRKYVLLNCHYPGHRFMSYDDGKMLVDFNAFPLRLSSYSITNNKPTDVTFRIGSSADSPYKKNIKGTSPSGWTTDNYPYLVEYDNWGGLTGENTYDEISWYANQPQSYRHEVLKHFVRTVESFNENGHVTMPGHRTAYLLSEKKQSYYRCNDKKFAENGQGDEQAIIEAYKLAK